MFRIRAAAMILALAGGLSGQPSGTKPRAKAEDYPVHARLGDAAIGAEYLLHSLPGAGGSFDIPNYLVIEIAIYPAKGHPVDISSGMFTLRVNAKKDELHAQAPGMVAASLKYPDWEGERGVEVAAGPVILGRRQPEARFPGDRRPDENRLPHPPQAPDQTPGGVERQAPQTGPEAVIDAAFPDGHASGPVSGFLFFAFKGKPKSIKSLELVHTMNERTVVRLF